MAFRTAPQPGWYVTDLPARHSGRARRRNLSTLVLTICFLYSSMLGSTSCITMRSLQPESYLGTLSSPPTLVSQCRLVPKRRGACKAHGHTSCAGFHQPFFHGRQVGHPQLRLGWQGVHDPCEAQVRQAGPRTCHESRVSDGSQHRCQGSCWSEEVGSTRSVGCCATASFVCIHIYDECVG